MQLVWRSDDAQQLLERAAGDTRGCNIPEWHRGLTELSDSGLITKMNLMGRFDHSFYTLTDQGRRCIKPCLRVFNPQKLLKHKREGISLNDFSSAEFVLHLGACGWRDVLCDKMSKNKFKPFTVSENNRVWYRVNGSSINKTYLHACAVAEKQITLGNISALHHGQPQNYYLAVIAGAKNVLPNQPLAYYKMLMKRADAATGNQEEDSSNHNPPQNENHDHWIEETGPICLLHKLYLLWFALAALHILHALVLVD